MPALHHITESNPLPLNLDGSSCINDPAVVNLTINQPDLLHLDLMNVQALEQLAIDCTEPAERHLRIQGASSLTEVSLQGHIENHWVLHLDLASFPHGLQVTAPVSHLDMCWLQDDELLTLVQKPQQRRWQEIHFYDLNQMLVDDFSLLQDMPDNVLLIFCGGYQQAMAPAFANFQHLLFTDIAGIDCLTVSGCRYLAVQRAVGLRSIAILDNQLVDIQLQQCPQFSRLTAPVDFKGQQAQLADAAHGIVELAGDWQNVKLRRSAITELVAGNIEQLHVTDCPNLIRLHAGSPLVFSSGVFAPELLDQSSFSINESMIRQTLQKLTEKMDNELIEALLAQATRQSKPHNVYHAIMLLQAFDDLNYSIERLWQIRCALYLQNQKRQVHFKQVPTEKAPNTWRWKIKKDRIFESYEADFLLWLSAYRQGIAGATDFMRITSHSALMYEPTGFCILCKFLAKDDGPLLLTERVAFIHHLTHQKQANTTTWLTLGTPLLAGFNRLIKLFNKLCQATVVLSDEQQQWRLALFEFLLISLSPKFLAEILPSAMQTIPEYVRPKLLAFAGNNELPYIAKSAGVSFESVKIWYTKAALARV